MVSSPDADDDMAKKSNYAGKKRLILRLMLAVAASLGALFVLAPGSAGVFGPVITLVYLALGVAWCRVDAESRGYELGRDELMWLLLVFVIAFPVYLSRTRGSDVSRTSRSIVVFFLNMIACALVAGLAAALIRRLAG